MTKLRLVLLIGSLFLFSNIAYAGDISNLDGAWLLDETSGTRVDQTANSNDLTDNNTVLFGTGQFGNSADFEATNSEYLSITDASQTNLDISGDATLGAWIKLESLPGTNYGIMSKFDATGNQRAYNFTVESTGNVQFTVYDTDGITGVTATSTSTLSTGVWYHVVGIHDTTNDLVEVWIDGTSDGTTARTPDTVKDSTAAFEIGSFAVGLRNFDGLIDEAFLFNRELGSSEITDIKDNGIESFTAATSKRRMYIIS